MALVCGPPHLHTCLCEHCVRSRLRRAQARRASIVAKAERELAVEQRRNVAADRLMCAALERGVPSWSMRPRA